MKAVDGKSRKRPDRQRNGLLAKVHIAKKELGIFEDDYRDILKREFGVSSAAYLRNDELETLVGYFESKGWQSQRSEVRDQRSEGGQVEALKERIGQELLHSDFTPARLRGLVRKICRVDDLRFCNDAARLKRLLAALRRIVTVYG